MNNVLHKLLHNEIKQLQILHEYFYVKMYHFEVGGPTSDGFIKSSRFLSTQDGYSICGLFVCLFLCFLIR